MTNMKDLLYAPLGEVKSRRGRGGTYDYFAWKDVVDRMNEAFGVNWSSEVKESSISDKGVVVRIRVTITDPETSRVQWQEGFGGDMNSDSSEVGNAFKSAYSKALKDACRKWGVGLHVDEELPKEAIPPGYVGKETAMPLPEETHLPEPDQFVHKTPVPPTAEPEVNNIPIPPAPEPEVEKEIAPPPSASFPSPGGGGLPLPPGAEMPVSSSVTVEQKEEIVGQAEANFTPEPPAPVPPTPSGPPAAPPTPPVLESKVTTINTGEPEYISDVQKTALLSILDLNKEINYAGLAKEALEANGVVKNPIPEMDGLTYQEAVYVVKYGNDKFRKR